jgi:hypothetical protein
MKIDPTLLTQKLVEANVHPGFYKMLGLKGPAYRWVKCHLDEVKVGDTIKIMEYDELPKGEYGNPRIPEGWLPNKKVQCGKEFKVATIVEARGAKVDIAYIRASRLYIRCACSIRIYCWHNSTFRLYDDYENNLFYVRRGHES